MPMITDEANAVVVAWRQQLHVGVALLFARSLWQIVANHFLTVVEWRITPVRLRQQHQRCSASAREHERPVGAGSAAIRGESRCRRSFLREIMRVECHACLYTNRERLVVEAVTVSISVELGLMISGGGVVELKAPVQIVLRVLLDQGTGQNGSSLRALMRRSKPW